MMAFKAKRYWTGVLLVAALISLIGYFQPTHTQDSSIMLGQNSGTLKAIAADSVGTLFARSDHINRILCSLTTTATTSTAITGCTAPGASTAIYVTDVSIYGGVALGVTAAAVVQTGTGGSCGTGTVILAYCQHGATSGCVENSTIPARGVTNGELCLLDGTTGTKFVVVRGFTGP